MHGSVAKHIAVSLAALIAFAPIARADYQVKDGNATLQTIKSLTIGTCNGLPCIEPTTTLMDASFNPFGVSNNPIFVAPGAGQTFPVSGTITCSNCSGSGVSATFGAAIGTLGAPGGYKDGSGNFQPLLGDVTNGLWVSLKQSVSLGVTGTFWPYTLGQQVASSSVPVALPATQVTALTPPAAITGFALETGGNLASINTKTPALGQALAASSVPVVLTALQLTALTPPTTVTANLGTIGGAATQTTLASVLTALGGNLTVVQASGANLHVNCDSGCSSSSSPSFGVTFPATGTPVGFNDGTLLQAARVYDTNSGGSTEFTLGVNLRQSGASGSVEVGTAGNPLQVAVTTAVGLAQGSTTSGQTGSLIMGAVSTSAPTDTNGQTSPVSLTPSGGVRTDQSSVAGIALVADPCQTSTPNFTPINISASGSAKIITGTASKKTYICHIHVVANAADNVALTEGTVTNCGTGTAGMAGGTTAASGWNFSANGGISLGNGASAILATGNAADDVCLNPSATTQLSGVVKWVQQ